MVLEYGLACRTVTIQRGILDGSRIASYSQFVNIFSGLFQRFVPSYKGLS